MTNTNNNAVQKTKDDIAASCLAAAVSNGLTHPIDTVRTTLQAGQFRNVSEAVRQLTNTGGVSALFQGLTPRLASVVPGCVLTFVARGRINDGLSFFFPESKSHEGGKSTQPSHVSVFRQCMAGFGAGLVQSVIQGPAELIKVKLQVQTRQVATGGMTAAAKGQYSGTIDCMKKIYQTNGPRGLYRGFGLTLARDGPGWSAYFAGYEASKLLLTNFACSFSNSNHSNIHSTYANNATRADDMDFMGISTEKRVMIMSGAGFIGGLCSWTVAQPFDVLKSCQQALPEDTPRHQASISYVTRDLIRKNGFNVFFRGFGPTLLRGGLTNAMLMPIYELSLQTIQS